MLLRGANGFIRLAEGARGSSSPVGRTAMNLPGITHFCVQATNIEDVIRPLGATGFDMPEAPIDLGTGFLYAYAWSPDGLVIEAEGAPFARVEPSRWIGHVAFATHDLDRLSRFYADLTGGAAEFSPPLSNNPNYDRITGLKDVNMRAAWVRGLNISLEFWQYLNPPTARRSTPRSLADTGFSHLAFEVDDVASAHRHALALGAVDLVEGGPRFGGEAMWIRDPDGNAVAFVRWRADDPERSIASLPHPHVIEAVALQFSAR